MTREELLEKLGDVIEDVVESRCGPEDDEEIAILRQAYSQIKKDGKDMAKIMQMAQLIDAELKKRMQ